MNIALIFLCVVGWAILCLLNYYLFSELCEAMSLREYINKLSVRTRNILFRIYILLGPISLVLTFIGVVLTMITFLFIIGIKWLIDIDNEDFI